MKRHFHFLFRRTAASSGSAAVPYALDALALDAEIEALLLLRWTKIVSLAGGSRFGSSDAKATLRAALLYLSSLAGDALPGEALLKLRRSAVGPHHTRAGPALEAPPNAASVSNPSGTRSPLRGAPKPVHRLLLGCLVVLLPWAWAKLSKRLAMDTEVYPHRMRWLKMMRRIEGIIELASVLVTLRFLCRGGSPTLPMLLVGMHLVPSVPGAALPPAFDFMEQQLIWKSVADLMLAGREAVHAGPRSITHRPPRSDQGDLPGTRWVDPASWAWRAGCWIGLLTPADDGDGGAAEASWDDDRCVFCDASPPHTPRTAQCGHHACYFCLTTAQMASAHCPRCGGRL